MAATAYALICALAAGCIFPQDGSLQPQGTMMGPPVSWDGTSPFAPPNVNVVPFTGQSFYVPPAPAAAPVAPVAVPVVSASIPALNGSYGIDATAIVNITAATAGIAAGKGFPNGASTMVWMDAAGVSHTFTSTAEFLSFGSAIEGFVYAAQLEGLGQPVALPALPLQIP